MIVERRRTTALLAGTALAAGLLAAGMAGSATAAPTLRPVTASHCVEASVPAGSTLTPAPARCFTNFTAAISFATDGVVRLPAGSTRVSQQQLDAGLAQRDGYQQPALASVVLGVSYKDTGWTGDTWIHTGSYGCDTDPDVDWLNYGPLSGPGGTWDNAIGSALAYSDCTGRYFAGASHTGAMIDTGWSGGVMNNAATSIWWY